MEKRIIYKWSGVDPITGEQSEGVAVIIPWLGDGLTLEQIAAKDVPFGFPYKIVDAADIPEDRSQRSAWTVDPADLTDGFGADYGAGSSNVVVAWSDNGEPVTTEVQDAD
jgi:hypothetical protein